MGKVYDTAYKTEVCKRVEDGGETVPALSRELGISEVRHLYKQKENKWQYICSLMH